MTFPWLFFIGFFISYLNPASCLCLFPSSSLSPYSFEGAQPSAATSTETTQLSHDHSHLSALSLFATSSPAYRDTVAKCIKKANQVYQDFCQSIEGKGYKGPVCLVADSTASLIVYDALCR